MVSSFKGTVTAGSTFALGELLARFRSTAAVMSHSASLLLSREACRQHPVKYAYHGSPPLFVVAYSCFSVSEPKTQFSATEMAVTFIVKVSSTVPSPK